MQLFLGLLLPLNLFYQVQFCLASKCDFHRIEDRSGRNINFSPLDSHEPINNEGEAIAYIGQSVASCIGERRPLSCLTEVIRRDLDRNDDPILFKLLNQPALLETAPYEHLFSCLGFIFQSKSSTNTIFEWLITHSLQAKTFYSLFDIDKSKLSFELRAIIDVIGLTARMYPPLAKYLGVARAVLSYVKSKEGNESQNGNKLNKSTMIQENQVDSIVAYLGGDCKSDAIMRTENLNIISLKEWKGLILHSFKDKHQLCTLEANEENYQVLIPRDIPIQLILKRIMKSYTTAYWHDCFDKDWTYESGLVIPGLAEALKNHEIHVNSDVIPQDEIIDRRDLSVKYVAELLCGWGSNIQDFEEVLDLLYRLPPRFNLKGEKLCNALVYSTLFYTVPDRAKQTWLWDLVRDELSTKKEEKKSESNGEKDQFNKGITSTSKNSPTTRLEMYQQGIKACGMQKPDHCIFSLLKMIDENRVEVIQTRDDIRLPILYMFWSLDDDDNLSVQFNSLSEIDLSKEEINTKIGDNSNNIDESQREDESGTVVDGLPNSDVLTSVNQRNERDVPQESKTIKKNYPKPPMKLGCKVYVLRSGLIHAISLNGEDLHNRPFGLLSGDLLVISRYITYLQLDEIAKAWFQPSDIGNGGGRGILTYMLLSTFSTAIRVVK